MDYAKLNSVDAVRALVEWHNKHSKAIALDTETTGLDPFTDTITAVVMTGKGTDSAVLFDPEYLPELLKLTVPVVVLHNFKFDYNMAYRQGVDLRQLPCTLRDTMLIDHLVDENNDHGLDDIVQRYWQDNYKEVFWSKYKSFEEAPENEQLEYACKDVIYTLRAYETLTTLATADGVPESMVSHVHNLALELFNTELSGLRIDLEYLTAVGMELKPSIEKWKVEMRAMAGAYADSVELDLWAKEINSFKTDKKRLSIPRPEFNFESSPQLTALLYDKMGLPEQLNKKTKSRTADDDALERLEHRHPLIPMLRQFKEYQKAYSSFIEGTLDRMQDGRIYPSFNINGTVTGRISSSNPNMQQLPSKSEWAKIRGIYIPDDGHKIITCDYSQLEVCIAAHYSMDKNLLKIVLEGASKHDITAAGLGIARGHAKTLNFAMQYQCSPRKVQEILGCSQKEAQHIWNKYWETYAGEKLVIDECKAKVDNGEAIVNPFGRRRRFPTKWEKPWHRDAAYRQAYSSLIQGTGADCTHEAFYTIARKMRQNAYGCALFEIHDEIVAMSKTAHCAYVRELLKSTMSGVGVRIGLRIPLSTDCSEALDRWQK